MTNQDQRMIVAVAIYLMLSSIPGDYPGGKRGRKSIMKAVKKQLAIFSTDDRDYFMAVVSAGEECMHLAKEEITDADYFPTNPGMILRFMTWRYPELVGELLMKEDHIADIEKHYQGTGLGFISIKYTNRLIGQAGKFKIPEDKESIKKMGETIREKAK